ncbi:hypothetical protein Q5P01_026444 [Channa striata]|uniref:Uncharacterized protein n=1 Tax=Channa striata TaxID=64152 RepID=A0AA88IL19_CHASR|nr:hypothetical protein Q5P01_026444 [Channa striata]
MSIRTGPSSIVCISPNLHRDARPLFFESLLAAGSTFCAIKKRAASQSVSLTNMADFGGRVASCLLNVGADWLLSCCGCKGSESSERSSKWWRREEQSSSAAERLPGKPRAELQHQVELDGEEETADG